MAELFQPTKMDAAKAMADIQHLVDAVDDGSFSDSNWGTRVEMIGRARTGISVACAYMLEGAPDA